MFPRSTIIKHNYNADNKANRAAANATHTHMHTHTQKCNLLLIKQRILKTANCQAYVQCSTATQDMIQKN